MPVPLGTINTGPPTRSPQTQNLNDLKKPPSGSITNRTTNALKTSYRTPSPKTTDTMNTPERSETMNISNASDTITHIHILLDRSGSMAAIAPDVIGGFNTFLRDQQANGADARITLVQFDSGNAQEVILAGAPIMEAAPLNSKIFQPRGGTPLLDATGRLIERARMEAELRATNALPKEDIVFVSITDGEENQSREYTLERVRQMIKECEADNWTFVFLSAGLDAYGEAGKMGLGRKGTQAFAASGRSVSMAMHSLSTSMSTHRERFRKGQGADDGGFFAEGKLAEEELKKGDNGRKA